MFSLVSCLIFHNMCSLIVGLPSWLSCASLPYNMQETPAWLQPYHYPTCTERALRSLLVDPAPILIQNLLWFWLLWCCFSEKQEYHTVLCFGRPCTESQPEEFMCRNKNLGFLSKHLGSTTDCGCSHISEVGSRGWQCPQIILFSSIKAPSWVFPTLLW